LAIIAAVSATCIRLNAAAAAAISASSGEIDFIDEITSATLSSAEVTLTITTEEASGVDVKDICEGLTGIGEYVINIGVVNGGVCDEESDAPTLGVGEGELVGETVIVGVGLVDDDAPSETVAVCVGVIVGVDDEVTVAVILELDEKELLKVFIVEPLVIMLPVPDKLAKFESVKIADFCALCDRVGRLDLDNKLDNDELIERYDEALDVLLIVMGECVDDFIAVNFELTVESMVGVDEIDAVRDIAAEEEIEYVAVFVTNATVGVTDSHALVDVVIELRCVTVRIPLGDALLDGRVELD
jgi:hypothetical protein